MKPIKIKRSKHEGKEVLKMIFDYDIKIKDFVKSWCGRWYPPGRYWWLDIQRINEEKFLDGPGKLEMIHYEAPDMEELDRPSTNGRSFRSIGNMVESVQRHEHRKKVNLMVLHLQRTRYAENTIQTYLGMLVPFLNHYSHKSLHELSIGDVHQYNDQFIIRQGKSNSTQRQLVSALRMFGKISGELKFNPYQIESPRKEKKLPAILSIDECYRIIDHPKNLKHKFILAMLYSCGLRIGELTNMKTSQLDLERGKVHIIAGKGNKDRTVGLSPALIPIARQYISVYSPGEYRIEGQSGGSYAQSSIRRILQRAVKVCIGF